MESSFLFRPRVADWRFEESAKTPPPIANHGLGGTVSRPEEMVTLVIGVVRRAGSVVALVTERMVFGTFAESVVR
jgi:hypothetical protein